MLPVKTLIEKVKSVVRGIMYEVAKLLDLLTNGFIRAWHITLLSLLGHGVILLALVEADFINAAILLIGFGLMDALDALLARYQGTESLIGMLLDSTTDRLKETLIYAGLAYYFVIVNQPLGALYSLVALGLSISVSYIKAKGEVALLEQAQAGGKRVKNINRQLEVGIFGYEVRMLVLAVSFAVSQPYYGVIAVAAGSLLTLLIRSDEITKRINDKS